MTTNRSYLYIVVTTYPYGIGEPFLEIELEFIAPFFKHVYLVIPESRNLNRQARIFKIPQNASIIELDTRSNYPCKIKSLFNIFDPNIRREFKNINDFYGLKFSSHYLRIIFGFLMLGMDFKNKLEKEIKKNKHKPEEVSLYSYWFTYATIGLALLKKKNPNYNAITRVHGWDCFFERNQNHYLPLRPWAADLLDGIISVSETGTDYLRKKLPQTNPQKIQTAYLGTKEGKPSIDFQFKKGVLRIVTIAFISPVKRLHLLIEALSEINEIPVEWTHIGSWSESNKNILALADEKLKPLPNIQFRFAGQMTSGEIFAFLSDHKADFLICTSESEGIPVSMMEAASHGFPILSTNVGGVSEIVIDGKNGFLMPPNPQPPEIKEYLLRCAKLNTAEYESLSVNSYDLFKEKFSAERNFTKFAKQILGGSYLSESPYQSSMEYKICSKCIIDNRTHPEIKFDEAGICDICHTYDELTASHEKEKKLLGEKYLDNRLQTIKKDGQNREYDCLLGLSGGVDSSYLAVLCKEWGLRPLALHVDNGWNTETAVSNIEKLVKQLDIDLITYVVNWEELRDLELAYMKASVVDIDIPNEMPFQAMLFRMAAKHKFKYILSGHNHASEGWLPPVFTHYKYDTLNLKDIHKKFGKVKLRTYPSLGFFRMLYYTRIRNIQYFSPLNYMDYNKEAAKKILVDRFGWKDYGAKHGENLFTRFYQSYILPNKFHLDKRRSHLSSLICAGQLSREDALRMIQSPHYTDPELERSDKEFFIKKLGISEVEFQDYIQTPPRAHTDFRSYMNIYQFVRKNFYFLKPLIRRG